MPGSAQANINLEKKVLFEKICRLAREQDEISLQGLLANGGSIHIRHGGFIPVILLAKEGSIDAVEFLLNKFAANINCAANGYARAGLVDSVEDLIRRSRSSIDAAVSGYARAGLVKQVDGLLFRGASISFAMSGYVSGGHFKDEKPALRILALTRSDYRRKKIANEAKGIFFIFLILISC
jgi:hypothetical protein